MPPRFPLSDALLAELRAWRGGRTLDEVERRYDAYCLDPGLGPGWFLTTDGRILRDGTGWDDEPLREATEAEAFRALAVGARRTGIAALLGLLPPRPHEVPTCVRCDGTRYASFAVELPDGPKIVCLDCDGLGWIRP